MKPRNYSDIAGLIFNKIEEHLQDIKEIKVSDSNVPSTTVLKVDPKYLMFHSIFHCLHQSQALRPIKEPTDEFINGIAMDIESVDVEFNEGILTVVIKRG